MHHDTTATAESIKSVLAEKRSALLEAAARAETLGYQADRLENLERELSTDLSAMCDPEFISGIAERNPYPSLRLTTSVSAVLGARRFYGDWAQAVRQEVRDACERQEALEDEIADLETALGVVGGLS